MEHGWPRYRPKEMLSQTVIWVEPRRTLAPAHWAGSFCFLKEARMAEQKYEEKQLYRIRHSAAHVMAQAVLEFYPETKYTIGPPVENGFYYDFDLPQPITQEDLEKIEKRMRSIIQGGHDFKKKVV